MSNSEENAAAPLQTLRLFTTVDDIFHKVYLLANGAHMLLAITIHVSRLVKVPKSLLADSSDSCALA